MPRRHIETRNIVFTEARDRWDVVGSERIWIQLEIERKKMKNGKLNGKTAVVTGASKGIGAGIAKQLAVAGASVAVNYASDRPGAEAVVAAITASGGQAMVVQGDVSKSADVAQLFVEVKAVYGALDVLVNNAAVYKHGPIEEMT